MNSDQLCLPIIFIIIVPLIWLFMRSSNNEGFTMSFCPNCFKRDKLQCFQCDRCVWCWTKEGYGECVLGNAETGPDDAKHCVAFQSEPDPILDYEYYTPNLLKWWDWTLSPEKRARLRNRYNFRQEIVK
jgi:hypothetical protein